MNFQRCKRCNMLYDAMGEDTRVPYCSQRCLSKKVDLVSCNQCEKVFDKIPHRRTKRNFCDKICYEAYFYNMTLQNQLERSRNVSATKFVFKPASSTRSAGKPAGSKESNSRRTDRDKDPAQAAV